MATRKPKADEPVATYVVLDNLKFNGDDYAKDDEVDMTADQAEPLLGTVVRLKAAPAA